MWIWCTTSPRSPSLHTIVRQHSCNASVASSARGDNDGTNSCTTTISGSWKTLSTRASRMTCKSLHQPRSSIVCSLVWSPLAIFSLHIYPPSFGSMNLSLFRIILIWTLYYGLIHPWLYLLCVYYTLNKHISACYQVLRSSFWHTGPCLLPTDGHDHDVGVFLCLWWFNIIVLHM